MKKIDEILKQNPVYLNDWKSKIDLIGDFESIYLTEEEYLAEKCPWHNDEYWNNEKARMDIAISKYETRNILFASYNQANYSGDAWVLFEENGELYEVNGSHCSCYGLEYQWEPEKVTLEELEYRLTKGSFGIDDWSENSFRKELLEFLGI